jgi:hypothetical protein
MCIRLSTTVVLFLVLSGCKPSNPSHAESGGFEINGRSCHYLLTDKGVQHVIAFDADWFAEAFQAAYGGTELSFERRDGRQFAMQYGGAGEIIIDNKRYQLEEGRVFIVTVGQNKNECRQLPISFAFDGKSEIEHGSDFVKAEFLKAAGGSRELATFIGQK